MRILYLNNTMKTGGVQKCIIQLTKCFCEDNSLFVASAGGELVTYLDKIGVKHFEIINPETKNPINIIRNLITLLRIITENKIEIIHSHHRMTTWYGKVLSKFTGVKIIHTQHSCVNDKLKLTGLMLRGINMISVSNGAKDILVNKCNIDKELVTTIYNTIDNQATNMEVDSRLKDLKENGNFVVCQLGRLVKAKGVYDLIEIAENVIKKEEKIRFVLIGDGVETESLNQLIKSKGLEEYIILLGLKNNIIDHLQYIDLMISCSYVEGLPLNLLEALSQGIPIVATDIPGNNEVVTNNKNGFLVDINDNMTFANKILLSYRDKDIYYSNKIFCLKDYITRFNKDKYINKHNEYYNKVIKEN